ncbi:hypothetical protein ACFL59_01030 [Planctomycetota bacterium]
MRQLCVWLLGAAMVIVTAQVCVAQGMPRMPTPQEIEKRIQEEFDKLPTEKVEHEVIAIEYKAMPTDPHEIVKKAVGNQLPPGMNVDQAIKQFMPMARPYVEKWAAKLGSMTVSKEVKYKSLKLKPDQKYDFGLVLDQLTPIGIQIGGGNLKAPVKLPLKRKKPERKYDTMFVEVVPAKKGKQDKLNIQVGFGEILGAAGAFKVK